MTPRPRAVLVPHLTVLATALLLISSQAGAQTEAPKASSGLDRAQKQADAVFQWIKINAEKAAARPTPAAAPAPAPAPAPRKPAPVAAAPKPAAAPTPVVAAEPAPAPVTASAAPAPAPALAPAPAPTTAAATPEPQAAPVLMAAAAPTPSPAAPMAAAAQAAEPPAQQEEEAEVPLQLLNRVNPTIPRQLLGQTFRNAFARVKFTVSPDGSVSKVESIKATNGRLATAAIEAVKQWRFAPIPEAREAGIEFAFSNVDE
ncbi:energy transducer TonB [Roseateles cellulosilyticus]|uniref:Energy transducer TonB n=1 Tax=Pelomonas cellulosilytica TaxID=2906762 RepID=A0ABS8XUV1_9BURK|nr:TonB family protein [Pelomonas sp. P8]MCE4556479.1 energy transducer TonB [Pelomonas sp. P8]